MLRFTAPSSGTALDFHKVFRIISSGSEDRFGLFGLFLGFLPFSIFYCAYISCLDYQNYSVSGSTCGKSSTVLNQCVSLDIELSPWQIEIFEFGVVKA